MGKINILNDAGTNKLSLEFNGTSDVTLPTDSLVNITGDVQGQLDLKAPLAAPALTGTPTANGEGIWSDDLPGLSVNNPGLSAWDLMTNHGYGSAGKPGNGWFWIQPTTNYPAVYTYCDFTTEGGGWTMWRSYEYNYRLDGYYANDNHQTQQHGFHWFDAPLSWKTSIKKGSYPEFLFYVSRNGQFDSHATTHFAVIQPTTSAQDFFSGSGSGVTGIPGYGNWMGYTIGQAPYSTTYHMYWWYNTGGYEPHTDVGHLPGAASSEDAFGYWGTINTNNFTTGMVNVKMVR